MAGTHFSRQGTLGVCRVYVCGIMGALMASGHPFPTFLAIDQTLCIEIQKSEIQGRKKLRHKKKSDAEIQCVNLERFFTELYCNDRLAD